MDKPKPQDVTSYDIIKMFAVVMMICDHLGFYFFHDNLWWRAAGRIEVPIWFFLPGYAQGREIGKSLWVGGLMLIAGNVLVGFPVFPVNALFTIILIRLLVDSIAQLADRHEVKFWVISIGLVMIYIPTNAFTEYGSLGLLMGILGWLVRNGGKIEHGRRKTMQFLIFSFFAFIGLEQFSFEFSALQLGFMMAGTAAVMWSLFRFRPVSFPEAVKLGRPVVWLTKFLGRNTLEVYVFHLLLFKAIILYAFPQNFLHSGLFLSSGKWN